MKYYNKFQRHAPLKVPEIKEAINKHWDILIINRNFEEVFINLPVLYFSVTRRTFQPKLKKIKKIHLQKSSLRLKKWNFLAVMFKKFRKWKPGTKILIFQETETLKKLLIFREMEPFSPSPPPPTYPPPKKNQPPKKFLIFQEMELFYSKIKRFRIFSQKKAFLIFSQKKSPAPTFWPHLFICTLFIVDNH